MKLNELKQGQSAVIQNVGGDGELRQHFLDMGVLPKSQITLIKFAPMGDPIEFRIHDYELTLRIDDAKNIEVTPISGKVQRKKQSQKTKIEHPGLGEGGRRQDLLGQWFR